MTHHITCRTAEGCAAPSTQFVLFGCAEGHTFEIAVCSMHANWKTIYQPRCRVCGASIEASKEMFLEKVTEKYQREYIDKTLQSDSKLAYRRTDNL